MSSKNPTPIMPLDAQIEGLQDKIIAAYDQLDAVRESETRVRQLIKQLKMQLEQARQAKAAVSEKENPGKQETSKQ